MNLLYRLGYRLAYRLILIYAFFVRPKHEGALVAVWHQGRVLLVKASYRKGWSLPGGGIDRGEAPLDAAVREAREEIGLTLDPAQLTLAQETTMLHAYLLDHARIFAVELEDMPSLAIDHREIVEAVFHTPEAALNLRMPPFVRLYLSSALAERARQ